MFSELGKYAKPPQGSPEQPPASAPDKPAAPQAAGPKTAGADEPTAAPADSPPPAGNQPTPAGDKKTSPWKLVDQYKARVADLEKQLADRTGMTEAEKADFNKRHDSIETRNKELEDEIRFVNYRKSKEFQDKYVAPYDRAWEAAMSELGELTITAQDGSSRKISPQDMLNLVNLELQPARDIADEVFGKFADDVMGHRNEIKRLWKAQAQALEEAKKNGAEREKQQTETAQRENGKIRDSVTTAWKETNEAALKDATYGSYFSPREGDVEGNERLTKGFALVDRAFKENPMDPRLTPEERAGVVKRHAAVRNRAAAFGRMKSDLDKANARIAELEKKIAEFGKSTPSPVGDNPPNPPSKGSARDQVMAGLQKYAKPA